LRLLQEMLALVAFDDAVDQFSAMRPAEDHIVLQILPVVQGIERPA